MPRSRTPLGLLPQSLRGSINNSLSAGVPPSILALYARWWQLETWLRLLTYVELKSHYGIGWTSRLSRRVLNRASRDDINAYMASPDATDPLSYYDINDLFELISDEWRLFEPSLLPRTRWEGLVHTLLSVRLRIAHARRPHQDDLERLEQTLRDLEPGAKIALAAYGEEISPNTYSDDPVVTAWVARNHPTAQRLIDHAQRQYGASFSLSFSRRPWLHEMPQALSGTPGLLWRVTWRFAERVVFAPRFWYDSRVRSIHDMVVHCLQHSGDMLSLTFSAVDDPQAVADAIGHAFDGLIYASRRDPSTRLLDAWDATDFADVDPRLQLRSILAFAEDPMPPFRIFRA